jgi:hypothetical protein
MGQGVIETSKNVLVYSEEVMTVVLGSNNISVIITLNAALMVIEGKCGGLQVVLDLLKAARII